MNLYSLFTFSSYTVEIHAPVGQRRSLAQLTFRLNTPIIKWYPQLAAFVHLAYNMISKSLGKKHKNL